jgi:hypothetical protein
MNKYKNIRTKETNNNVDNEEYKLLSPNYVKLENQEEVKSKLNLQQYRTHKDPWNTKYNSVDNFILAQYSKEQVSCMVEEVNVHYDYVMYIRPDCFYLNNLDVSYFNFINNNSIIIPDFHLFSRYKINDRFAITNTKTLQIYGKIFSKLPQLSKKYELHSETIIGMTLEENKIRVIKFPFFFSRVRCDGRLHDKSLLHEKNVDKKMRNLYIVGNSVVKQDNVKNDTVEKDIVEKEIVENIKKNKFQNKPSDIPKFSFRPRSRKKFNLKFCY